MFFNKKTSKFIIMITFLVLIFFLNFLFFYPKFGDVSESINLNYLGEKNIEETEKIFFEEIQPGDIVAHRPVSFLNYYSYMLEDDTILNNFFIFFIYYNLFDKILINSMGESGYWHVYIYLGDQTLNSLDEGGVTNLEINSNFFRTKYLKILRVDTKEENIQKAIERAILHEQKKDISYSLKSGIIISFAKSTGIIPTQKLYEDKMVCSSYQALIFEEVTFNPTKHLTYISPEDLDNSKLTSPVFLKNEKGIFVK